MYEWIDESEQDKSKRAKTMYLLIPSSISVIILLISHRVFIEALKGGENLALALVIVFLVSLLTFMPYLSLRYKMKIKGHQLAYANKIFYFLKNNIPKKTLPLDKIDAIFFNGAEGNCIFTDTKEKTEALRKIYADYDEKTKQKLDVSVNSARGTRNGAQDALAVYNSIDFFYLVAEESAGAKINDVTGLKKFLDNLGLHKTDAVKSDGIQNSLVVYTH